MTYTPHEWRADEEGGTPITAEALNEIEAGIADAHAANDELGTRTDTAQATAEAAQTAADTAQTAADTAQTTAEAAQTTADTAQASAEAAQATADAAQTAVEATQTAVEGTTALVASHHGNALPWGDFENIEDFPEDSVFTLVDGEGVGGSKCLKVLGQNKNGAKVVYPYTLPCSPGDTFQVSLKVKPVTSVSSALRVHVVLRYILADGSAASAYDDAAYTSSNAYFSQGYWTTLYSGFTVPAYDNLAGVQIGLSTNYLSGYVDDITLLRADTSLWAIQTADDARITANNAHRPMNGEQITRRGSSSGFNSGGFFGLTQAHRLTYIPETIYWSAEDRETCRAAGLFSHNYIFTVGNQTPAIACVTVSWTTTTPVSGEAKVTSFTGTHTKGPKLPLNPDEQVVEASRTLTDSTSGRMNFVMWGGPNPNRHFGVYLPGDLPVTDINLTVEGITLDVIP